jgi:hypothetical protein
MIFPSSKRTGSIGWNAYMRNGTIKSLRWLTGEPFPVISGLRVGSIALHQIDAVRE